MQNHGLKIVLGSVLLVLASGCAHLKPGQNQDSADASASSRISPSVAQVLQQDLPRSEPPAITQSSSGDIYFRGMKLQNSQFDYPITLNSRVEFWVDYFQGKGRKHFTKYLERSELFIPFIRPLLKQNNMPEDLVYLAMIESGFNNHARSHAKAVGPWQFISATGKRYGLMVNWWVDERRDTRKSTLAAVEYLKDLYTMFQSWELAAAAYNAGEAKVARAIRRFGTYDFWTISRHRFLRPETRDYVPKIIAAALIAKNRTQFGFPAATVHPGANEAVAGDGEVVKVEKESEASASGSGSQVDSIAAVLKSGDYDEYEDASEDDLMPATLTVPAEGKSADGVLAKSDVPQAKPIPTPSVSKKGEVSGEELMEFEVQSPADLLKVSRAAGLSYQTVKSLNPELLRWCTPPNVSSYRIKLPSSVKEKFLVAYNDSSFPKRVQFLAYKVRKGETISRIAQHFGIKVDPISDLNGLSARTPLRNGTRVLLPMPNDRSRSLASLEVRDPPEKRRWRGKRGGRTYKVNYKKRESARTRFLHQIDS